MPTSLIKSLDDAIYSLEDQLVKRDGYETPSGKIDWKMILVESVNDALGPEIPHLIFQLMDARGSGVTTFPALFDIHARIVNYLSANGILDFDPERFLRTYGPLAMKIEMTTGTLTLQDQENLTRLVEGKDPLYNPQTYLISYNKWKRDQLHEGLQGYIRLR